MATHIIGAIFFGFLTLAMLLSAFAGNIDTTGEFIWTYFIAAIVSAVASVFCIVSASKVKRKS